MDSEGAHTFLRTCICGLLVWFAGSNPIWQFYYKNMDVHSFAEVCREVPSSLTCVGSCAKNLAREAKVSRGPSVPLSSLSD